MADDKKKGAKEQEAAHAAGVDAAAVHAANLAAMKGGGDGKGAPAKQ